jgi:uncharacterized protein (DUF488 family)
MADYVVFTIGHGDLSWTELARLLHPAGIEVLVDVRSYPYYEFAPWFNRDQLEHLARREGWEYIWLGSLLGPLTEDGRVDYIAKETEPRYREGIKQLMGIAGERRACLLGSQPEPTAGHRHHLVAQTLLRHNIAVRHLLHNGRVFAAQSDLFHSYE